MRAWFHDRPALFHMLFYLPVFLAQPRIVDAFSGWTLALVSVGALTVWSAALWLGLGWLNCDPKAARAPTSESTPPSH